MLLEVERHLDSGRLDKARELLQESRVDFDETCPDRPRK